MQGAGQPVANRRPAWVTVFALVALLLVSLVVVVPETSLPSWTAGAADGPYPGIRGRLSTVLVRRTDAAPLGDLAFLAVEPSGFLVVTDRARKMVYRFDPSGTRVAEWGPRLGGTGVTLGQPAGVALSGDGGYYVVDRVPPRVVHLDSTGNARRVLDLQPYGTYGLNGIAVDRQGLVYVADTGRNRILVLSPEGQLRLEVGRGGGKAAGQFMQPMQLAFSPVDGALLVSDWENSRVQRFAPAPDLGPLDAWPTVFRSFGLAVDARGRAYVADPGRSVVQVYAPRSGTLLGEVGGPGSLRVEVPGLVQVAVSPLASGALVYALGPQTIARIEMEDTPPPAQPGPGLLGMLAELLDPSTLAVGVLTGLVALLVRDRNRRRARASAPEGAT